MTNPTKPDAFEAALEAHLATDRAATGITLGEALWIARWAREWTLRSDPVVTAMAEALEVFVDDEACRFDHNKNCQTHASFNFNGECHNALALAMLAAWREACGEGEG